MVSIIHTSKKLLEHLVNQCNRALDSDTAALKVCTYGVFFFFIVLGLVVR